MGKASRSKRGSAAGDHPDKKRDPKPSQYHSQGFLQKTGVHILLIIVLGFLAYSNTFHSPFQWDDKAQIIENPIIKDLDNFISSTKGYGYISNHYNPRRSIGYLTFALNYHFGGLNVTGYHIVNLLVHLANAILVYFLILLTFRTPYFRGQQSAISYQAIHVQLTFHHSPFTIHDSRFTSFIALFSALFFVAHPIQTQAVTYIVQRFASLATMFYLLSLVLYIKGRLITEQSAISSQRADYSRFTSHHLRSMTSVIFYLLSLVFAILAMKTKEIAFTLPIMIFLYEFIFFRSSLKKKLFVLLPIVLVLASILVSVINSDKHLGEMLSDVSESTRVQTQMPRWDYLMTQMRVITTYVRLIFLPVNQNFDYDYPIEHSLFTLPVFFSFLFLAALFGTAVYLLYRSRRGATVSSKKLVVSSEGGEDSNQPSAVSSQQTGDRSRFMIHDSRLIGFGILWFFITLSVESSIIPIRDVIFEHRLYLPSVGLLAAITTALFIAAVELKMEKIVISVLIPVALLLSGLTYARNVVWTSNISLWEDVVSKSPNKARAHNNLGTFYGEKGDDEKGSREFQTALELNPDYSDAHFNLGFFYHRTGRMDEAIREYQTVLKLNPNSADAHNNLGALYEAHGRIDEALAEYQTAVKLNPDHVTAQKNLERLNKPNKKS